MEQAQWDRGTGNDMNENNDALRKYANTGARIKRLNKDRGVEAHAQACVSTMTHKKVQILQKKTRQ